MKKNYFTIAVLAFFSIVFWCLPSYFDQSEAFQKITVQTRDIFFKIRHLSAAIPDKIEQIVIVTIDEESCERLEARWPWPRTVFATMIDELKSRGAKVIGLNVSFTGLEAGDESSTRELARAIREHGNVIIGATFDKESRVVKPSPIIAEAVSRVGYLEKIVDPDFSIRRSYFLRPYSARKITGDFDAKTLPLESEAFEASFPLQILSAYLGSGPENNAHFDRESGWVSIGRTSKGLYLAEDGSYTINYLAYETDFEKIPAWKIVTGKISALDVRDKVVLVGLTSSLFSDMHQTPYGIMPGIIIHANEFLSVISGRVLRFVPDEITFLLSWLVSLCVLALFLFRRFWLGILGLAAAFFGLFMGAEIAFTRDIVIEPFPLIFGPFLSALVGVVANSLKLLLENKGLETKVIQDKLTHLYTYEFLRLRLEDEWKRCQKAKVPVSVAMTDLDRFKKINDTLGHEVGNQMILRAAAVIKESVRGYDIVARYGGDEFVILLWHANLDDAKAYRLRLRDLYHGMAKKLEEALQDSSISIGVASFDPNINPDFPANPQALIEEADKDLFIDKESRRKGPSR